MRIQVKLDKLKRRLKKLDSVLVAFSAGVDSTLMLKLAVDVLKDKVLAVTADSATYPQGELAFARRIAQEFGVRHKIIKTHELSDHNFCSNPKERCYYCKKELFSKMKKVAQREGINFVVDGSNVDDSSDYRPGSIAKEQLGIISPLQEAGFTKNEVRRLSKRLGLINYAKPALACLASRVPYNSKITKVRLKRINLAEDFIRKSFLLKGNLRVRDFGKRAVIEVDKNEMKKIAEGVLDKNSFKCFGYEDVSIDPKGYRRGSLNEGMGKGA